MTSKPSTQMNFLLDTNVLSELLRPEPDARVFAWIDSQPSAHLWTTALTQAEMLAGVALMPAGKRREAVASAVDRLFAKEFADRVLPFDAAAAPRYAAIRSYRKRDGRPVAEFDAAIAAIALSQRLVLATRNVRDFEGVGLDVLDPWAAHV